MPWLDVLAYFSLLFLYYLCFILLAQLVTSMYAYFRHGVTPCFES